MNESINKFSEAIKTSKRKQLFSSQQSLVGPKQLSFRNRFVSKQNEQEQKKGQDTKRELGWSKSNYSSSPSVLKALSSSQNHFLTKDVHEKEDMEVAFTVKLTLNKLLLLQ